MNERDENLNELIERRKIGLAVMWFVFETMPKLVSKAVKVIAKLFFYGGAFYAFIVIIFTEYSTLDLAFFGIMMLFGIGIEVFRKKE